MKNKKPLILLLLFLAALAAGVALYMRLGGIVPTTRVTIDKTDGYKLLVNGKPFLVKGVCYSPVPIGKDYEFNFWGDAARPWQGDAKHMKEMGVNTIRIYRPGKNPDEVKRVLREFRKNGIYTLMGNYLGYGHWPPADYADENFKNKIRVEILEMVRLYKDEPGILMWVLGNENNYAFDRNLQSWSTADIDAMTDPESRRKAKAEIYYSFVNSLAQDIKKIDTAHPVVLGVGEVMSLDIAGAHCKDIDLIGMIAYRGPGFGNLFRQIKQKFDIPVVMIEWGADSFNASTKEPDESSQAEFVKLQWMDIERNSNTDKGVGNCVGGTLFEWNDEWWKANENVPHTWSMHDTAASWGNGSYYYDTDNLEKKNMNEEWWGVVALKPEKDIRGNNKRSEKQSFAALKSLWTNKK
jgi:hypothetical protein